MKRLFIIKKNTADLSGLDLKDEFVCEVMNHEKLFTVAGKVIANRNLLGDDDLDIIWDLANWGVSQLKEVTIKGGCYEGMKAFGADDFIYIPLRKDIDVVNDNIMIRKHYDTDNGYYLKSDRHGNCDEWCYATRQEILADMRANPFI